MIRTLTATAFVCTVLGACNTPRYGTREPAIDELIARQTAAFLRTQPKLCSSLDLDASTAGGSYAERLSDYSPAGFAVVRELERSNEEALAAIPRSGLSGETQLTLAIVEKIHDYYAGSPAVEYGYIDDYFGHVPYAVNQLSGPIIDVPKVMTSQQRIASVADAEDYLARLEAFGPMLEGLCDKFKSDARLGVSPPAAIVAGALSYLDGFTKPAPAEHVLVTHLASKLAEIEGLPLPEHAERADHKRLTAAAARRVEGIVYPGYKKLARTLREHADRLPRGDGIWAQPNGAAMYADLVRFLGDTDLDPDRIHALGLSEVERISAEMDAVLVAEGYRSGTVGERMAALGAEERFLYPDTDEGRASLLSALNAQIDEIDALLPRVFRTLPTQGVEVRRTPVHMQDGAPGGYYDGPSADGERPGIYWINLRDIKAWAKPALPTLTYHEALPGHHLQVALSLAQEDLPLLRRSAPFNAYTEGWALYAERLAWELGLYADDPFGNLGRLQAELYRAVRLVVDTGLHHRRWSRERAIEYFAGTTGRPLVEVTSEIERYMAWPAQALGYKLGMLKIVELRALAQEALGAEFDLQDFHDLVLLEGAMPLVLLEQRVREWIADTRT